MILIENPRYLVKTQAPITLSFSAVMPSSTYHLYTFLLSRWALVDVEKINDEFNLAIIDSGSVVKIYILRRVFNLNIQYLGFFKVVFGETTGVHPGNSKVLLLSYNLQFTTSVLRQILWLSRQI